MCTCVRSGGVSSHDASEESVGAQSLEGPFCIVGQAQLDTGAQEGLECNGHGLGGDGQAGNLLDGILGL